MNNSELLQQLRQLVGSLPAGAALDGQRKLCSRFGVSTWILDRVLRQLERDGLVEVVPRRGIFVSRNGSARKRNVRVVYLDNPNDVRNWGADFGAITDAASRAGVECRGMHLSSQQFDQIRSIVRAAAADAKCHGVVFRGYVTPEIEDYLRSLNQPWVLQGNGNRVKRLDDLPTVTDDGFQGARLAAEDLLEQGCTHVLMVNFRSELDWPHIQEARSGAFAVLNGVPGLQVFCPEIANVLHDISRFEQTARQWIESQRPKRLGILCRRFFTLPLVTPLRHFMPAGGDVRFSLMDGGNHPWIVPGMHLTFFSAARQADACLHRLEAMRRGQDSPGWLKVPYVLARTPEEVRLIDMQWGTFSRLRAEPEPSTPAVKECP